MEDYMTGYNKIKEADMYGPDELTAILMNAVQQKVREVKSNEDFKDWSTEFIISVCTAHTEDNKKTFDGGR